MEYVLGFDAGGTHFRVRAISLEGELLGTYQHSSLGYFSQDTCFFMEGVSHCSQRCLSKFSGVLEDCKCLVAGVAGIDSEEDRFNLEQALSAFAGCPVYCYNDAELANETINDGYGILLNSGTGSIAFGCNSQGVKDRIGGWPLKIFGDEGSGAWIALKVIRLVARWFDGLVQRSVLIDDFLKEYHITSRKSFMDFCLFYSIEDLAKVAPLVDDAALHGDAFARSILQEAGRESFYLVRDLAEKLGYGPADEFKVGIWGSNILKSSYHLETFRALLAIAYPNAILRYAKDSLVVYAAETALKLLGETHGRDQL